MKERPMSHTREQERYGEIEQLGDGRWRLRFTRTLPYPPEKVWSALTEPEHLAHWFPTTIEGERAAGAALRFCFEEDRAPAMDGEMLAYEPTSAIEMRWGPDVLRFELRPVTDGTELTLLDTLEAHGKAARDGAGWHVCLDWLEARLRGEDADRASPSRWRGVHPRYVERFGAEAATIGPPDGYG
jgi:uncharacterized protein YndB with AHSA1/START domain